MTEVEMAIRRFVRPLIAVVVTIVVGIIGYVVIEGWSVGDAAYMVITTIATVGYREIHPLSPAGKAFTSFLIVGGVASVYYLFGTGIGILFEGQLNRRWAERRMERRVEQLRDHYIVCGYGRVGQEVARTLHRHGQTVVVIDRDSAALIAAAEANAFPVTGDASEDDTLRRAGIERASGLITAVATDADNVFVVLSARALRPDLPIVARGNNEQASPKLRRAGATQVVSPYAMAGERMAFLAARPSTVSLVETLLHGIRSDFVLEEIEVATGSPLSGLNVSVAARDFAGGAIFLAVQRKHDVLAPPPADLDLTAGDLIAAAGRPDQLAKLENACQPLGSPIRAEQA
ncbi:MAG: potassium channel protein [Thermomicrobiales bacterium]|nr:potassium channel protein [Thermomicrobiales bacterium]